MATDTTNGQATTRPDENPRGGASGRTNGRARGGAAARASGPFEKSTRLCVFVPLHIVMRLEGHARALGKSRDEFAGEILDWTMARDYGTRDAHLRNAYGIADQGQAAGPEAG